MGRLQAVGLAEIGTDSRNSRHISCPAKLSDGLFLRAVGRNPGSGLPIRRLHSHLVLENVVIVVHLLVAFVLVLLILLHAGRGGGMSDMFGGGMGPLGKGSTVMERNLDRLTVGAAASFGLTTVLLTWLLRS